MSHEHNFAAATPDGFPSAASEEFVISKVLFCTWHGNMSRLPARLIDVTSAVHSAGSLAPKDLVTAAQRAYADLPNAGEANERYRATTSGMFNFTVTASPSNPIATFRVPFNTWAPVPIIFSPSSQTQNYQSKISLTRTGAAKLRAARTHIFVHKSTTYTWAFPSGMEINLRDEDVDPGTSRVLAKFHYVPSWFESSGVLLLGERTKGGGQPESEWEWEHVVVVTLLACLRREREWRYTMAIRVYPMKRTYT